MSGKLRILWDNPADAATLTDAPAMVATLPVENLQRPGKAGVARTTGLTDQVITGDLAAPRLVDSMVLWLHNLTFDATVRLELFDGLGQTGTLTFDSGAVAPYGIKALGDLHWGIDPLGVSVFSEWGIYYSSLWFGASVTYSFRLTLSDPTNPAGYMEAARLLLGPRFEPTFNFSWGHGIVWNEDTTQERTAGGSLRSDPATPFREAELNLDWLSESDRPKVMEMRRLVGLRQDFFISMYPAAGGGLQRDYEMLGKFVSADPLNRPDLARFTQTLRIQEA